MGPHVGGAVDANGTLTSCDPRRPTAVMIVSSCLFSCCCSRLYFVSFGVDAPEEKPEKWRRLQLRNVADDRRGAALRRTRGRCETVTSRKNEKKKKTSAGEAFFLFFFAWKLFLSLAQWFNL